MTIAEFNEYNRTNTMPCDDIGQGMGYKAESWDSDDDIIYIPENGYDDEDETVDRDNAYSLNDLISVMSEYFPYCNMSDTEKRAAAESLFAYLDWSFPSTVLDECESDHTYFGIDPDKIELPDDRKALFEIMSNDMDVMSEHDDDEDDLIIELAYADDDQIAAYKNVFMGKE